MLEILITQVYFLRRNVIKRLRFTGLDIICQILPFWSNLNKSTILHVDVHFPKCLIDLCPVIIIERIDLSEVIL